MALRAVQLDFYFWSFRYPMGEGNSVLLIDNSLNVFFLLQETRLTDISDKVLHPIDKGVRKMTYSVDYTRTSEKINCCVKS